MPVAPYEQGPIPQADAGGGVKPPIIPETGVAAPEPPRGPEMDQDEVNALFDGILVGQALHEYHAKLREQRAKGVPVTAKPDEFWYKP